MKAHISNKTKSKLIAYLAKSLIQRGAERCVAALPLGTTAKDMDETITFIEQCTMQMSIRHGELYIAKDWRIPWTMLTRHEIMATKLLFAEYGTCVCAKLNSDVFKNAFNPELYLRIVTNQLGPALRQATHTLHRNRERWWPHGAKTTGQIR